MNIRWFASAVMLLMLYPDLGQASENSRRIEELLAQKRVERVARERVVKLRVAESPSPTVKPPDLRRTSLQFFDAYDWYGDSYFAGWASRDFDLIVRVFAEDHDNTIIRANFLQLGERFRLHLDYMAKSDSWDFGPSLRIFKSEDGDWAVDWEPSLVDGRTGFLVKTPFGPIAKLRFDSVKNKEALVDGLARGLVTNLALAGTKPPKSPMGKVAEHVGARIARRFLVGGGNPLLGAVIESLVKRIFRGTKGLFKFLDAPNTRGLTVSKQTIRNPNER